MTDTFYADYMGLSVRIRSDNVVASFALRNFLLPHFAFEKHRPDTEAFFDVTLTRGTPPVEPTRFNEGEPVFLRKSANEYFTLSAKRLLHNDAEFVRCDRSGTVLQIREAAVIAYLPFDGYALDLIEVLRHIFFRRLEQQGVLALHATVLEQAGKAVLVVGSKGAGKTTFALHLATKFGFRFVSGDKAFITLAGGKPMVTGWPDFPHIGAGTLKQLPGLADRLGLQLASIRDLPDNHKMALDPDLFRSAIPHEDSQRHYPVRCVLYPEVGVREQPAARRIGEHRSFLEQNVESSRGAQMDWGSTVTTRTYRAEDALTALAELPAWRMSGVRPADTNWFEEGEPSC